MPTLLVTFDERISWLLKRPEHGNGMSQKELAAAMEISEQFLSALMKGRRKPNVRHLAAAAKCLNTSVSFLALASDNPAPDSPEHDVPSAFSAHAIRVAELIDTLELDSQKQMIVDVVKVLVSHKERQGAENENSL